MDNLGCIINAFSSTRTTGRRGHFVGLDASYETSFYVPYSKALTLEIEFTATFIHSDNYSDGNPISLATWGTYTCTVVEKGRLGVLLQAEKSA